MLGKLIIEGAYVPEGIVRAGDRGGTSKTEPVQELRCWRSLSYRTIGRRREVLAVPKCPMLIGLHHSRAQQPIIRGWTFDRVIWNTRIIVMPFIAPFRETDQFVCGSKRRRRCQIFGKNPHRRSGRIKVTNRMR